ncbi:class I SAM-dependent methyltransferase [Solimonas flava]|uniref:class I SAM-dependent methyltransferase n=1 Tax=Solimonas flava TaxID=415849 RepID=UPI000415138E|nr:class I SAM-dependent methyltransferase [Solimonas flava]
MNPAADPTPAPREPGPAWRDLDLPDAWPDRLRWRRPRDLWQLLRKLVLRRVGRVELPPALPLRVALPKYLLLEFHNLPNGNYSKRITHGYSTGFDRVMLGEMRRARAALAACFTGSRRVLDLGCGAGYSSQALVAAGVPEVWGLDASPYLLQHAARQFPQPRFVQGLAERTELADASFDGVAACFLFHELPPRYARAALDEARRLLRAGGRLAILEPAPEQFIGPPYALWRAHGWRGLYFWGLARFVNEPFIRAWHRTDVPAWLDTAGFTLIEERTLFPARLIVAERRGG